MSPWGAHNLRNSHERGSDDAPEQDSVSTRYVPEPAHRAFWNRSQVRGGAGAGTLARRVCVPELRWTGALVFCCRWAQVLAVLAVQSTNDGMLRYLVSQSKLPLTKWFHAIYLVTQNKNNISALSLKRHLGVCYRTA